MAHYVLILGLIFLKVSKFILAIQPAKPTSRLNPPALHPAGHTFKSNGGRLSGLSFSPLSSVAPLTCRPISSKQLTTPCFAFFEI